MCQLCRFVSIFPLHQPKVCKIKNCLFKNGSVIFLKTNYTGKRDKVVINLFNLRLKYKMNAKLGHSLKDKNIRSEIILPTYGYKIY